MPAEELGQAPSVNQRRGRGRNRLAIPCPAVINQQVARARSRGRLGHAEESGLAAAHTTWVSRTANGTAKQEKDIVSCRERAVQAQPRATQRRLSARDTHAEHSGRPVRAKKLQRAKRKGPIVPKLWKPLVRGDVSTCSATSG